MGSTPTRTSTKGWVDCGSTFAPGASRSRRTSAPPAFPTPSTRTARSGTTSSPTSATCIISGPAGPCFPTIPVADTEIERFTKIVKYELESGANQRGWVYDLVFDLHRLSGDPFYRDAARRRQSTLPTTCTSPSSVRSARSRRRTASRRRPTGSTTRSRSAAHRAGRKRLRRVELDKEGEDCHRLCL